MKPQNHFLKGLLATLLFIAGGVVPAIVAAEEASPESCVMWGSTKCLVKGTPYTKPKEETEKPTAPPNLEILSITLSEPSDNNILDAGETGKIKVALKNSGKGAGFGVSLSLAPTTSLPKGMQFSEKTYIGQINSGEEKAIEVEITGSEEVQTSEINLKATLVESNGFDSQPIILAFKTKDLAEIYGYIKPIVEDEAKMLNVQQSPGINPDAEKLKGRFSLRK